MDGPRIRPIDGASTEPPILENENTSRRGDLEYDTTRRFDDLSKLKAVGIPPYGTPSDGVARNGVRILPRYCAAIVSLLEGDNYLVVSLVVHERIVFVFLLDRHYNKVVISHLKPIAFE